MLANCVLPAAMVWLAPTSDVPAKLLYRIENLPIPWWDEVRVTTRLFGFGAQRVQYSRYIDV